MKLRVLNIAAVTTLAAAMAFGQAAPTPTPGQGPHGRGGHGARFGADLGLTDAQKQQMKTIFSDARQSGQSVNAQLKQSREALAAAVKSGAPDAEIDRLSNSLAPLLAQSTAIRTKAFAKFYSILTPEQKDKIGDRFNMMMNGFGGMRGGPQRSGFRHGE